MKASDPFFVFLRTNSVVCDAFLAVIREAVVHENSLERVNEKTSVDYQRGKVAVLRHLESLANNAAQKRGEKGSE